MWLIFCIWWFEPIAETMEPYCPKLTTSISTVVWRCHRPSKLPCKRPCRPCLISDGEGEGNRWVNGNQVPWLFSSFFFFGNAWKCPLTRYHDKFSTPEWKHFAFFWLVFSNVIFKKSQVTYLAHIINYLRNKYEYFYDYFGMSHFTLETEQKPWNLIFKQ